MAKVYCVLQLMMTLKFSRNWKVTRALTEQSPVRPAVDEDFGITELTTIAFRAT